MLLRADEMAVPTLDRKALENKQAIDEQSVHHTVYMSYMEQSNGVSIEDLESQKQNKEAVDRTWSAVETFFRGAHDTKNQTYCRAIITV